MSGIERARLGHLDSLHGSVRIGLVLQEVSPDRWENDHQIGTGEERRGLEA